MKIMIAWLYCCSWMVTSSATLALTIFYPPTSLANTGCCFFFYLLIDRLWNATLAVKSHRKPIENADWTTSPVVERGKYYEKKKNIHILPSRRIMGELWDEIRAFNRVEKCFGESDNRTRILTRIFQKFWI